IFYTPPLPPAPRSTLFPYTTLFRSFDSGQITLNEYLDRTVFYRQRGFTREEFAAFMFAQSKEYPETRAVLDKVAGREIPCRRHRSEDHTSELQSPCNLVCRLLLEKK